MTKGQHNGDQQQQQRQQRQQPSSYYQSLVVAYAMVCALSRLGMCGSSMSASPDRSSVVRCGGGGAGGDVTSSHRSGDGADDDDAGGSQCGGGAAACNAHAAWPGVQREDMLPYGVSGPVQRVEWATFVAEHRTQPDGWRGALVRRQTPLIFTGGIASTWRAALQRWGDADYWAQHEGNQVRLGNCFRSHGQNFRYFDEDRPLVRHFSMSSLLAAANLSADALTVAELWAPLSQNDKLRYCSVDSLGDTLAADLANISFHALRQANGSAINVWIGDGGTSANPHHDTEHNLYSVVQGQKLFHLWPPSAAVTLYAHPYSHPGGRQSQAPFEHSFDAGPASAWPAVGRSACEEAVLEPGETLYVPPYWMHRVLATRWTLAVNVWTQSQAAEDFARMQRMPLPIPTGLHLRTRVGKVSLYIDRLASLVVSEQEQGRTLSDLVATRYRHGSELLQQLVELAEDALMGTERKPWIQESWCRPAVGADADDDDGDVGLTAVERKAIADVAAVLRGVEGGEGVTLVLLMDYVELVATAAFREADTAFLLACYHPTYAARSW
jgi:hypothetical protein